MSARTSVAAFLVVLIWSSGTTPAAWTQTPELTPPLMTGIVDAASLTAAIDSRLARATNDRSAILTPGRAPLERLQAFDEAQLESETADSLSAFIARVSPDAS